MLGHKEGRHVFWDNTSAVIFTLWVESVLANFIFEQSPLQTLACLW